MCVNCIQPDSKALTIHWVWYLNSLPITYDYVLPDIQVCRICTCTHCPMHYIDRKQFLEKLHNFIPLNLAIALFLAFLIFVAGVETAKINVVCNNVYNLKYEYSYDGQAACKAVTALFHYFWLSAFCWMMCEGVMMYLMLVVVFSTLKKKWWFLFLLGWGKYLCLVVHCHNKVHLVQFLLWSLWSLHLQ